MKYVIITPAFNEEKNIGFTIESVLTQTIKPILWVIVDDGSNDGTAAIIKKYEKKYSWIKYILRKKNPEQSYYASNVYALQKGVEFIDGYDYNYIAILDADITLPENYYENIAQVFLNNDSLGIASGNLIDKVEDKLIEHLYDHRSCTKAVMVLRRECYEQIGGFVPMKHGGEDTCACFTARMKGWKTWSYPEYSVIHNKPLGTGYSKSVLTYRFRQGVGEYYLATHPIFLLAKSVRRCFKESPLIFGGLLRITGFVYAYCFHEKRQISDELIKFIQKEQAYRVFNFNKIPDDIKVE